MNKNRNIWLITAVVIVLAALVSAFMMMQPSAKDILTQTIETMKTIENGHAILNISVDSPEENVSGAVEVWGLHEDGEGHGAFRLEVLETDKEEAQGMLIVSDGESVWVYSPVKNTVFTGSAEEFKAAVEEKGPMRHEFDMEEYDRPENTEEVIDKLLEYFEARRTGVDTVANIDAYNLELTPIPEQLPAEYTAIGGLVNLWIDKELSLPLAVSYTGGSMGEVQITALEMEVNQGVDEALFTFEIPEGVEVIGISDMKPESITLDDAAASVDFDVFTPDVLPEGATLVDVLDVQGMIVQQFTLPEGGSFSISQGQTEDVRKPAAKEQTVEVREVEGSLFVSEEFDKVMLSWTEGQVSYIVAGNLTAEQALEIANSLK